MEAEVIRGPGSRTVTYDNPVNIPSPLPAGATIDQLILPSTHSEGGLDPEQLAKYAGIAAKLEEAGVIDTDVDWKAAAGLIATGFAVAGVVGAIAAAVFFGVKTFLKGQTPVQWANSGPGVHAWFTAVGPQGFLDWINANDTGMLRDIDTVQRGFVLWSLQNWKHVMVDGMSTYSVPDSARFLPLSTWQDFGQGNPNAQQLAYLRSYTGYYVPPFVADVYASVGVDYPGSVALRRGGQPGVMMLNQAAQVRYRDDGSADTRLQDGGADEAGFGGKPITILGVSMSLPGWMFTGLVIGAGVRYLRRGGH